MAKVLHHAINGSGVSGFAGMLADTPNVLVESVVVWGDKTP
ncbi:MAG: hypothetical protein QGG67_14950 [Gammaproteobacteria bacterium]|jgi:hypothetical protein|nr:hypothetical protein [Gammaproteobacteria bacterium]HJO12836.1 hypothetical protein [Gammaproteobacteria bacterium]|tara:strand:+ start:1237 stop:1359 length:123 start_codon:yes stop_codon:yes gene_type:complete